MRFGSVEFFKVLIKTVLAVIFFVPLILAVVFGVLFANESSRLKNVQQENNRLSAVADILVGEKAGGVEDFNEIFKRSGTSYEEFIALVNKEKNIDAQGFYDILSNSGVSDKDIIAIAAAKKTVNSESFYEILANNGITDADLISVIANKGGGTVADYYDILSQCGLSDDELVAFINKKNGDVQGNSSAQPDPNSGSSVPGESDTSSPYASLYEEMYVQAPENYVSEEGAIYLTFDDGPSQYTYTILSYLRKYGVKATFFVVPKRTDECYQALKAIAADGHAIGIHSATHEYEKIYASVEAYLEDFHEAWDIVREATGNTVEIFRFPGGSNNDFDVDTREAIIKEMSRRGFRFYDWNVDSGDVMGATWSDMYNSLPRDIKNSYRSVVLMHDSATCYNTVLVLEDVLKLLVNEGYKFDKINNDTEPVQFVGPFS